MILALAILVCTSERVHADPDAATFAKSVNVESIRLIALQNDGRFKTFDTEAREIVKEITGRTFFERRTPDGVIRQDPVFTFLDLAFNPDAYRDIRVIFVKKKPIRDALVLAAGDRIDRATRNQILDDGLVSMAFLGLPSVQAKVLDLQSDVLKGAKDIETLQIAMRLATDPQVLMGLMRVVPPPGSTDAKARWYSIVALTQTPQDAAHAMLINDPNRIAGMAPKVQSHLAQLWAQAGQAWRSGDAVKATQAIDALSAELPRLAPAIYPPHDKLALEHWYYKTYKMTWTWIAYMVSVIFLLMGIVYRWPRARAIGVAVFGVGFALHTVACGIRWYLAGRIPNSNMFEAVTAAAWFGAAVVMFFEAGPWLARHSWTWRASWVLLLGGFLAFVAGLLVRGVPFHEFQQWGPVPIVGLLSLAVGTMSLVSMGASRRRNSNGLLLLGSAVACMVAMMCWYFMDIVLDNGMTDIENRMPVLNDVWLYIHTNMIIASYALIAIAYVTSAMYVVGRLLAAPTRALWAWMLAPTILIPIVSLIPGIGFMMVVSAWIPFALVIGAYLLCQFARLVGGHRLVERSLESWDGRRPLIQIRAAALPPQPVGGLSHLLLRAAVRSKSADGGNPYHRGDNEELGGGLARVLDGATMILFELFFITLWTGVIMGAVWADHSWGRPWGWDPKEVFALNTWIIFLILVHVRIKVVDKALWTAVLGVVGCSVMLFNWIVVNFFITGLHSYA